MKILSIFSLLQPKYCKEKSRHSPLALGRAVSSSLPKVNGCAALFQMGAEGYLGGTWAAALHSTVLLRGTAAAQRPQARRLLNCFLRGSDIKSTYKPELKRGCVGHCLPRELLTAPGTATVFRCWGHCYNPAQLQPCKELLPAPCSSFQPYSSEPSYGLGSIPIHSSMGRGAQRCSVLVWG